jgi:transposase
MNIREHLTDGGVLTFNHFRPFPVIQAEQMKAAPDVYFLRSEAKRAKAEGAVIYWGHAIELFFLPPYAPEINPPEYLNHALKQDVRSGGLPRTKKDIKYKTRSYMRRGAA